MLARKMARDIKLHAGQFISATLILILGLATFSGVAAESYGLRVETKRFYTECKVADLWLLDSNFNDDDIAALTKTGLFTEIEPRLQVEGTSVQDTRTTKLDIYYLQENEMNLPISYYGDPFNLTDEAIWLDYRYAEANNIHVGDQFTFTAGTVERTLPVKDLVYSAEYVYRPSATLDPDFNNRGFAFMAHQFAPTAQQIADAQDAKLKAAEAQETTSKEDADDADGSAEGADANTQVPAVLQDKLPQDLIDKIGSPLLNDMIKGVPTKIIERTDAKTVEQLITQEAIKRGVDLTPPADPPKAAPLPDPDSQPFNQLTMWLTEGPVTDPNRKAELEQEIQDALGRDTTYIMTRDQHPSFNTFESEMQQHETAQKVFPWVFIAVSILITVISMIRMVNAQRIQIGTLRALGFSQTKVIMHYLGYGFWPALIGCSIGIVLGPKLISPLFYTSMSYFYTLPYWYPVVNYQSYVLAVVVVFICTLAVFLAIKSALIVKPATSLRPHATKTARHIPFEGSRWFRARGFIGQWNYRDVFRSPVRALMTILGAAGCMMLLLAAFNMHAMVSDIMHITFDKAFDYKTALTLDDATTATRAQEIADEVHGWPVQDSATELKIGNEKINLLCRIRDPQAPLNLLAPNQKDLLPLQTEDVALTEKIAKEHHINVGDTIEWRLTGANSWNSSVVREIYYSPSEQGITVSTHAYEELDGTFEPTAVYTTLTKDELPNKIAGVTHIDSIQDEAASFQKLIGSMATFVYLIIVAAFLLLFIVVYNTGLLMYVEMFTELATLRTLGFSIKTVQNLMTAQTMVLSAIGCVLGIPFSRLIITSMEQSSDEFDFTFHFSIPQTLIAACIVLLATYIIMLLFIRKIKRIDMVEALKGGE